MTFTLEQSNQSEKSCHQLQRASRAQTWQNNSPEGREKGPGDSEILSSSVYKVFISVLTSRLYALFVHAMCFHHCTVLISCWWSLSFSRCCFLRSASEVTVPKPREGERGCNHFHHCRTFPLTPVSSGLGECGHISTVLKETIMMLSFQRRRQRQWGGWSLELTVHKIPQISSLAAQCVSD